jgi:hypothetical protein
MQVSETKTVLIRLETEAGVASSYASKALFEAAGGAIAFYNSTGSLTVTYTLSAISNGIHKIQYALPAGQYWAVLTAPTGEVSNAYGWTDEGFIYDTDYIGSLLTSGDIDLTTLTDTTSIYEFEYISGNSIKEIVSISENALTRLGAANLAACTITCSCKDHALKDDDEAADFTLTTAVVTDSSGDRTVRIYADTFPVGAALPDDVNSKTFIFNVDLVYSGKKYTGASGTLTITKKSS